MSDYINYQKIPVVPRLPLKGRIDLTYRCNNNCRHCWLKEPSGDTGSLNELTTEEVKDIVDQARAMGCRRWEISGGEPMLRPDFPELFDYITSRSATYSLNTNGTLITPEIARLMTRKGNKMVSMYGATAGVHDHITRCPGSFDAMIKGFSLLKEAGAGFVVQIIPMRDNYHEYDDMVKLAESLSPQWRVGAPWLYLSSSGSPEKNAEIKAQRLDPEEFVKLAAPDIFFAERYGFRCPAGSGMTDDRVFAVCIGARKAFHIDSFGGMSFCSQIKDPQLRYDLRSGSFQEAWEQFIPSLADKVRGGKEYLESCHSCPQRPLCHWCGVYGFLENGRYGSRVDYLCRVTKELFAYREEWERTHRRYFTVAGITLLVESDLPFKDDTFDPKFRVFETAGPGTDNLVVRHHFSLPVQDPGEIGSEVYRKPPWAIYRKGGSWVYQGIFPAPDNKSVHTVAVFNDDHTVGEIYHRNSEDFMRGGLHSLTLLPTDQVLLSRVLPERQACMMHSSGVVLEGKGLLFVGHSGAGKSTITRMVMEMATVLSDDRNIIRRLNGCYTLHGCWSHGEIPLVSSLSAPLEAVFFLIQSEKNQIHRIVDSREAFRQLTGCVVRPLTTADWWNMTTRLLEGISQDVPSFVLEFDRSGAIVAEIQNVLHGLEGSVPEKRCPG